jgi:hypothetical protein
VAQRQLKGKGGRQASLGIAGNCEGIKKTHLAFRFKNSTINVMAKALRTSDVTNLDPFTAAPSSSNFWENWFEMQPAKHPAYGSFVEEHGIWEKAVSLELLAMNEMKF